MRRILRCSALCFALRIFAQAQTGYLTYPAGTTPLGATAADLNNDGLPDLIVANVGSDSLSVFLNRGATGFEALPPVALATSFQPMLAVAADLNGDHQTDLVVFGAQLAVLLGKGDGTFQAPQVISGLSNVTGVQIGDLNGDGIPDLAVTFLIGGAPVPTGAILAIYSGNGDGTFAAGASYSCGPTPWAVPATITDFNGDARPDIAVAVGQRLILFVNDGTAHFTPLTSPQPWNFAGGLAVGDFNGDGTPDLAAVGQSAANLTSGILAILLGNGDGTFRAAPSIETASYNLAQISAADLNADGHVDLAVGLNPLTFFAGHGDGTFESGRPVTGSGTTGYFALARFDGSGTLGFAGTNDFQTSGTVQTTGNVLISPQVLWPSLGMVNVSSAGFGMGPQAPGSIVTAFGSGFANVATSSNGPPLDMLGETSLRFVDSSGAELTAPLYYVSPGQVNYVVPSAALSGKATVVIQTGGVIAATGEIEVAPVAPALFTENTSNLLAANVLVITQDGNRMFESIYHADPQGNVTATPIDLGSDTDAVYLSVYGSGIRNASGASAVTAIIGQVPGLPVIYAGPQGVFDGLDQVNVLLPRWLVSASPYTTTLQLVVNGQPSNVVTVPIQ